MDFGAVPHKDVLVVERHDHVVHVQHAVLSRVRRGRHFTSQSFMSQLQHGRNSRLVGGSLQLRAWLSQTPDRSFGCKFTLSDNLHAKWGINCLYSKIGV